MSGPTRQTSNSDRRRGGVLVYAMIAMVSLIGVGSLAVDYARVQAVKTDLQKAADAAARGALTIYQTSDGATAQTYAQWLPTAACNPVESGTGVQPTVSVTWGRWDAATKAFTAGSFTPPAVRVTVSRTTANNNAVPLALAGILGRSWCDVSATAIAVVNDPPAAVTYTVSSQADPWLAGMPAGSTASYNDTAPAQSPQAVALPPGATGYITFTSVTGTLDHGPGSRATPSGPDGKLTQPLTHGADSPGGPTPAAENGISDITAPICSLIGVFLGDAAPNSGPTPVARDYSTTASRDATSYDDLSVKQTFYIGNGKTTSGTVQRFKIPAGATRLFLGPMDGHEWSNNAGSFSVTVQPWATVSLVR